MPGFYSLSTQTVNPYCRRSLKCINCEPNIQSPYDYLYGINPVMIAIHNSRRTPEALYLASQFESRSNQSKISNIYNKAQQLNLQIQYYDKVKSSLIILGYFINLLPFQTFRTFQILLLHNFIQFYDSQNNFFFIMLGIRDFGYTIFQLLFKSTPIFLLVQSNIYFLIRTLKPDELGCFNLHQANFQEFQCSTYYPFIINDLFQEKLNKFCSHQPHQGVILKCSPLEFKKITEIDDISRINQKENGRILVFLDQITDPQNLGAILRTCFYLGIDHIIVGEENNCPLNTTVSKTSSGAVELLDVYQVEKNSEFVKCNRFQVQQSACQKKGFVVVATDVHKGELLGSNMFSSKDNLVVLIGSEGQGLSKQLKEGSNKLIQIKNECKNKEFPNTLVDSLNVNAATSIILYELKKQLK